MVSRIGEIKSRIEPYRQEIIHHKVYSAINNIESLRIFMQYHAYAVWDFMSLLKSLQISLTSTTIPWFPKGSANTRYLINEIVVGEESDLDMYGNRKSHFEMYLDAMNQCDASTKEIESFIATLQETSQFTSAYKVAGTPMEVKEFVDFTFSVANSQKGHLQTAVFTFGREELIPSMFNAILADVANNSEIDISLFKYYIERHIEVDGGHHSHLAVEMTENLCGENEEYWQEAGDMAIEALKKRISLWDGAYDKMKECN